MKRNMASGQGIMYSVFGGGKLTQNDVSAITNYANAIKNGVKPVQAYKDNLGGCSVAAKQYVVDARKAGKSTDEMVAGLKQVPKATTAASVGLKALAVAGNMLMFMGISWAISSIIKGIDDIVHASEKAKEAANELLSELNSQKETIEGNISTIKGLEDEFKRLSKGVDDYGANISLSADEYERYQQIVKEIVGISPSLIAGYDKEGNAIANKNSLIEQSIELLKEENRQRIEGATSEETVKTLAKGKIAEYKDAEVLYYDKGGVRDLEMDIAERVAEAIYYDRTSADDAVKMMNEIGGDILDTFNNTSGTLDERIEEAIARNAEQITQNYSKYRDILEKYLVFDDLSFVDRTMGTYSNKYSLYISKIESAAKALNPTLQTVPQSLTVYDELSDRQKAFIAEYVNTFRITADTTEKDVEEMRQNILEFTQAIGDAAPETKRAIEDLFSLDKSKIPAAEWEKQVNDLINKIVNSLYFDSDEDKNSFVRQLKIGLGFEFTTDGETSVGVMLEEVKEKVQDEFDDEVNKLGFDELQIAYKIIAELPEGKPLTWDELRQKIDAATHGNINKTVVSLDNLTKASEGISSLQKAFKELSDDGYITTDTISKIKEVVEGSVTNWSEYENTLLTAKAGSEEFNQALSDLTYAILENEFGVDGLVNATEEQIAAVLRENGVLEAEATAQRISAEAKIKSGLASNKSVEAIEAEIKALGILETVTTDLASAYTKAQNAMTDIVKDGVLKRLGITEAELAGITSVAEAYTLIADKAPGGSVAQFDAMYGDDLGKLMPFIEAQKKVQEILGQLGVGFDIDNSSKNEALDNALKQAERSYKVHQDELEYIEDLEEASRKYAKTEEERLEIQDKIKDARKDYADNRIEDIEHEIEMLKNLEGEEADVVDKYKEIQRIAQEEADRLRAEGYKDSSTEIQDLQKTWWDAQSSIDDGTFGKYLEFAEDLYGKHQDEIKYINDLMWGLNNLARTEEQRAEINGLIDQARVDYADNRISDIEHEIELLEHLGDKDAEIIEKNKEIQRIAHEEADRLRALDYAESSEEIQKWQKTWWDAQDAINTAKENILADIEELVSEANDLLDGFQNVYTTLTDAAKEYNSTGYLSVDSLQSILELSPKYLDFLYDENGQLVLNEQALQNVIKAQTEDVAVQNALSYAKQILAAVENDEIETLTNLTNITTTASNATWDMAYSTLALAEATAKAKGIDTSLFDFENAVSNLKKMQSLAKVAVDTVSKFYKTLDGGYISQKDGLEQILSLTQDLIKWEQEKLIESLEQEKEDYQSIIEKKKEILRLTKEEKDREKSVAEKLKEIAKLQSRIEQLSLDDSREAQAQKKGLEEELSKLQQDLADEQAEYAVETQIEALDKEYEAFEDAKDDEIKAQKEMLDSAEELYQAAISRIENDWDNLYNDLLSWNAEYGSTLQSDIVSAWDAASDAVQRYGSFVKAYSGVNDYTTLGEPTDKSSTSSTSDTGSIVSAMKQNSLKWFTASGGERSNIESIQESLRRQYEAVTGTALDYDSASGTWLKENGEALYKLDKDTVASHIVGAMKNNSGSWHSASASVRKELEESNEALASTLENYLGQSVYKDEASGAWFINGKKLFDVYHTGGVVGGKGTLKQNEVLAVLEKGEIVLDEPRQEQVSKYIDRQAYLRERFGEQVDLNRFFALIGEGIMYAPPQVSTAKLSNGGRVSNYNSGNIKNEVIVNIQHSGSMSDNDLKRYGDIAANATLTKLNESFSKRGIHTKGNSMLRP